MIWELLGSLFGAFVFAAIIYNVISLLINVMTRYKMKRKKNIIVSLVISLVIMLILAETVYTEGMVLTGHIPALFILFLYDFFKVNYQRCPHCAERIKADAFKCKHCHSDIRKIADNELKDIQS